MSSDILCMILDASNAPPATLVASSRSFSKSPFGIKLSTLSIMIPYLIFSGLSDIRAFMILKTVSYTLDSRTKHVPVFHSSTFLTNFTPVLFSISGSSLPSDLT